MELRKLVLEVKTNVGGHGIVANLHGDRGARRTITLRAVMDALPILEKTNLSFSSQYPGVIHACRHDVHTSILLGAASLLYSKWF